MISLLLIRHARTAWNTEGRMQGRSDVPLSPEGRAEAASWRLPIEPEAYRWLSSPLARARQTAELLGRGDCNIEPNLIEMDWGDWEGERLVELRRRLGAEMATLEAKGLDFRPPGGESPRQVQDRLRPWLRAIAGAGRPVAAVTHKGVIRALYALASGWDMAGKPPVKLRNDCLHRLRVGADGALSPEALNLPLLPVRTGSHPARERP